MSRKHFYTALFCLLFYFLAGAQVPNANFNSDITAGCSPIVVNFQDQSTGNPTSWLWDFGNGATSTLKNPSATYFADGTYTVSLIATNAQGSDTIVKSAYISVSNSPVVDFAASTTAACGATTIQFSDLSTAAGGTTNVRWEWDFGDGTTSMERNPSKLFSTPEVYTITLTVTNNKGCAKTVTKANYINISAGAIADFNYTQPATCAVPVTVSFGNLSTGPGNLSYQWNFGDGTTSSEANPAHIYTSKGKYTVTLNISSNIGCNSSIQKEITVGEYITDFTVSTACEGASTRFTNASSPQPVSSLWVFPDGTTSTDINTTKALVASGSASIKLINDYGTCRDSITKVINVIAKPVVAFSIPDTGKCQPPFTVNFINASNATSYQWSFGDGATSAAVNPSHTFTQFGNYSVSLIAIDANGCRDSLTKQDFVHIQKPVIRFPELPQRGCLPYATTFKSEVTSLDNVLTYQWNFGDGSTSTEANPSHTYTNRGNYAVTLTITTSTGCTETFTMGGAISVGPKPIADFTADKTDICASDKIQFTDLSTPANEITEWAWKFSDGSTSIERNPLQDFTDTGFINVELVVFNNGCPSQPMVKDNYVHIKPPIAQFTFAPNCNKRNEISFTNSSIVDPALPTIWEWNFGDGTTSNDKSPASHTFPKPFGSWQVSLKVTNGSCSFTYQQTIKVEDPTPDVTASSVVGCKPFNTTFQATSNVSIVSTLWEFGDGTTTNAAGATQAYTYNNSGNYNVKITITDEFGCQATRTKNQYIKVYGPVAGFVSVANQGCKGFTANFTDQSSTDGAHPITSWKWDFGDSKTQTFGAAPFQHKYDTAGVFDVLLQVKDSYGCTDSIKKDDFVTVSGLKANWNALTQTCPGSAFQFANLTTGNNFNTVWDFGDGNSSTDRSPFYAYADTGFYTIKLNVSDAIGCQDSLIKTNHIQVGSPNASFNNNNLVSFCTPYQARFQNTSTYYTERFWDLGIATSRLENPSLYYTASGTYDIRLIVVSPGGCRDTVIKQLKVFNPSDARITYGPILEGCRPIKISLQAFEDMDARFVWDFGDGNVIDTSSNTMEHVYTDFGSFTPRIIMTEPSGKCRVALVGNEVVEVYGAAAKFGLNNTLFCDSAALQIIDSTTYHDDAINYTWNFGDGSISNNAADTAHYYPGTGNYTVSLIVSTAHGCTDTAESKPIKIVQSPLISILSDSPVCINNPIRHAGVLERSDTAAVQWIWQFPNGNRATAQYPANQVYTAPGSFDVTAYAINSSGCADTATQKLLIHPAPQINLPPILTKQAGVPITIPATYSTNVTNYLWEPGNTLSCTDCPQPVATPKLNTKYVVSIIDSNGCKNTDEVQVMILCPNSNVFVPNTFSPNGDGSNDVFYVRGKGLERVKSIRIFNRWGEVVFEKREFPGNDASVGWDGKYKGTMPQADVYVYQLEVFCESGEVLRFDGNVALIQ